MCCKQPVFEGDGPEVVIYNKNRVVSMRSLHHDMFDFSLVLEA